MSNIVLALILFLVIVGVVILLDVAEDFSFIVHHVELERSDQECEIIPKVLWPIREELRSKCLVKVKGGWLRNSNIQDGDIVIVRPIGQVSYSIGPGSIVMIKLWNDKDYSLRCLESEGIYSSYVSYWSGQTTGTVTKRIHTKDIVGHVIRVYRNGKVVHSCPI